MFNSACHMAFKMDQEMKTGNIKVTPHGFHMKTKELEPVYQFLSSSSIQENIILIQELVSSIQSNLECLEHNEGEINVSGYDTAWIAKIPHKDDETKPQFPSSLDWIVTNQHEDGSWGHNFESWHYDSVAQTLACIVTLKYWGLSSSSIKRGEEYIKLHVYMLQNEEMSSMPIGFELYFPFLLMEAKGLGLNIPYDDPFFLKVQGKREEKLKRIPLKLLHTQTTTMLHTLEGVQDLDVNWQQLLQFCSSDGSMCGSPASTAALYMHTRAEQCLSFMEKVTLRFNHAAPTVYPLDTFHNLWVVDTLERLGISHHFKTRIQQLLTEIYRSWSDVKGICWAKALKDVEDLDDTSMAFRLLRKHGFEVSAESFKSFQKGNSFVCFAVGQTVQGVSDMFNLFRATQVCYPEESRLHDAERICQDFLSKAIASAHSKENGDKWSLKKNLSGEVKFALEFPKYKTLDRMEIRHYLSMYGHTDAWIGKTIYRLPLVNNAEYLTLAKMDFNFCQQLYRHELQEILRWIEDSGIEDHSYMREKTVLMHAMFSAELWEPEYSCLRIEVGKTGFTITTIYKLFKEALATQDMEQFIGAIKRWKLGEASCLPKSFKSCFELLFGTVSKVSCNLEKENHITLQLVAIWRSFASSLGGAVSGGKCSNLADFEGHPKASFLGIGLETLVMSSILASGQIASHDFVMWMEGDLSCLSVAKNVVEQAWKHAMIEENQHSSLAASAACTESNDFKVKPMAMQEKKNLYRELNLKCHQSGVPYIVGRVLMGFTKASNFYYEDLYGKETFSTVQNLLSDFAEQ